MANVMPQRDNEQFPLLKPGAGGGDVIVSEPQLQKGLVPPTKVLDRPQQPKRGCQKFNWIYDALPAYWICFSLLIIALSIMMISTYMSTKNFASFNLNAGAASEKNINVVNYHYIIKDNANIPMTEFSIYLGRMADIYPNLKFHVYFVQDDILQSAVGHTFSSSWPFIKKQNYDPLNIIDENVKTACQQLEENHANIKIFIKPFSTLLQDKCLLIKMKDIAPRHLPFFLRVYMVWRHGGIALDLVTYYHMHPWDIRNFKTQDILVKYDNAYDKDAQKQKVDLALMDEIQSVSKFMQDFLFSFKPMFDGIDEKAENLIKVNDIVMPASNNISESNEKAKNLEMKNETKSFADKNNTISLPVEISLNSTDNQKNNSVIKTTIITFFRPLFKPLLRADNNKFGIDSDNSIENNNLVIDIGGTFIASGSQYHPFLGHILMYPANICPFSLIKRVYNNQCEGASVCSYCSSVHWL